MQNPIERVVLTHEPAIVFLAVTVCLLAAFTAFGVKHHALGTDCKARGLWVFAAAMLSGTGIWATHFIAILAYRPGIDAGFDLGLTLLSIAVAVLLMWAAIFLAAYAPRFRLFAGVIAGVAIASMHFIGMASLVVPARLSFDMPLVYGAITIGTVLSVLAFSIRRRRDDLVARFTETALFTIAICGLHFTAMGSVILMPDPTLPMPVNLVASEFLAILVAVVTLLIMALGVIGASLMENQSLQRHLIELEDTRSDLARALEGVAAASEAKSQFIATMSHEFRTPLNAVIGFSEVIRGELYGSLGNQRYQEYARLIHESGRHLLALVNDVLDLSRVDAGRLELSYEPMDLVDTVVQAVEMTRPQAESAGLHINFRYDVSSLPILADERRLRQVLLNLFSNAIKFTPEGGLINVRLSVDETDIRIDIRDTGMGMNAADIPQALERFGQIDEGQTQRHEGSGLGLPLAKHLVELHKGRLSVQSRPGQGTTVTVLLPIGLCVAQMGSQSRPAEAV